MTPRGLFSRMYSSAGEGCRSRRPSNSIRSESGSTCWPTRAGSPFTSTRPAAMASSIARREPKPARASTACSRRDGSPRARSPLPGRPIPSLPRQVPPERRFGPASGPTSPGPAPATYGQAFAGIIWPKAGSASMRSGAVPYGQPGTAACRRPAGGSLRFPVRAFKVRDQPRRSFVKVRSDPNRSGQSARSARRPQGPRPTVWRKARQRPTGPAQHQLFAIGNPVQEL